MVKGLERIIEALKLIFRDIDFYCKEEDGSYDEDRLDSQLERLKKVVHPAVIEQATDLAMALYDRNNSYKGEQTASVYGFGTEDLFTIEIDGAGNPVDGERFITNPMCAGQSTPIPDVSLRSSKYSPVVTIGMHLPHIFTGDGEIYCSVIMENNRDPAKYLLVQYYKVDGSKIKRVMETNDAEYAKTHKQFGFEVNE